MNKPIPEVISFYKNNLRAPVYCPKINFLEGYLRSNAEFSKSPVKDLKKLINDQKLIDNNQIYGGMLIDRNSARRLLDVIKRSGMKYNSCSNCDLFTCYGINDDNQTLVVLNYKQLMNGWAKYFKWVESDDDILLFTKKIAELVDINKDSDEFYECIEKFTQLKELCQQKIELEFLKEQSLEEAITHCAIRIKESEARFGEFVSSDDLTNEYTKLLSDHYKIPKKNIKRLLQTSNK